MYIACYKNVWIYLVIQASYLASSWLYCSMNPEKFPGLQHHSYSLSHITGTVLYLQPLFLPRYLNPAEPFSLMRAWNNLWYTLWWSSSSEQMQIDIRSVSLVFPLLQVGGERCFQHLNQEISCPLSLLLFAECPWISRLLWSDCGVRLSLTGPHSVTPTVIPGISSQRLLNLSANRNSSSFSPGGLLIWAAAHLHVSRPNWKNLGRTMGGQRRSYQNTL